MWRLQKIDELSRRDHYWLEAADECFYWGEYTAYVGYSHSPTNDLINNFKKTMDRRGRPEWRWKEHAIRQVAALFKPVVAECAAKGIVVVPVPPSKARTDPLYDDRLAQAANLAAQGIAGADVRDCIVQAQSSEAVHAQAVRPRPEDLLRRYTLAPDAAQTPANAVVLLDDVLTTGCHFKAAQALLRGRFPGIPVYGFFVARRAITHPNAADVFAGVE